MGHVAKLSASDRAKKRLRVILDSLDGSRTVADAAAELAISESRFHALRKHWLQHAVELLEPRPTGRPPKQAGGPLERRADQLETELKEVRTAARLAEVRREIGEILGCATVPMPGKKTAHRAAIASPRVRGAKRLPR